MSGESNFEATHSGGDPSRLEASRDGVTQALRVCGGVAAVAGLLIGYSFREVVSAELFEIGWRAFILFLNEYMLASIFAVIGGVLLVVAGRKTWGYAPAVALLAWALIDLCEYARIALWSVTHDEIGVEVEAVTLSIAWLLLLVAVFGIVVCTVATRSWARPPVVALVVWLAALAALLVFRLDQLMTYVAPGFDTQANLTGWAVELLGAAAAVGALVFAGLHPERAVRVWAPALFGVVGGVYWLTLEGWRYLRELNDNLAWAMFTSTMVLALIAAVLYALLGRGELTDPV